MRVLLSHMPRMLRDMLEDEILHRDDLELLDDTPAPSLSSIGCGPAPDVIILGAERPGSRRSPRALLRRWPGARVMSVTPNEGEATLYELTLHTTALGSLSPAELVQRILETVRRREA